MPILTNSMLTKCMSCAPAVDAPRPPLSLLGSEPWRAAAEFLANQVMPAPAAAGDGHPVTFLPGLASDGNVVAPLRSHCQRLGCAATDWGRGWNTGPRGDVDRWLHALADAVQALLADSAHAPTLIGWSLGGIDARELAKLGRLQVRQVITIGAPFNGTPEQTHVGWVYRLLSGEKAQLSPALRRPLATAPPVPTTSIYSRTDGVVAWQACRHGAPGRQVQDVEVQGSHLGMGWNPRVLRVVADRLAQRPGHWRRCAVTAA